MLFLSTQETKIFKYTIIKSFTTMSVASGEAPEPRSAAGLDFSQVQQNAIEDERAYVTIQPVSGAGNFTAAGNNTVTIPLPKDQRYLDMRASSLTATISVTANSAVNPCLSAIGSSAALRRVALRVVGGGEILRVDFYNRVLAQLHKYYADQWIGTAGRKFGKGSLTQRQADAAVSGGLLMEFDLMAFGIVTGVHYVPLWLADLEWELELEQDTQCLVSQSGTDASYTLSNIIMNCELVRAAPAFDAAIRNQVAAGVPVSLPVELYRYIPATFDSSNGRGISVQRNISVYVQQFLSYMCYFSLTSAYNSATTDQFDSFVDPALKDYQVQIGSRYYPRQPIDCQKGNGQALIALHVAAFKRMDPIGALVDGDNYDLLRGDGSEFQIVQALGQARDAHLGAGVNTKNPSANSIVLLNQLSSSSNPAAPEAVLRMNQIAHYAGVIQFALGSAALAD
jgi:hypothetical protein